MVANSNKASCPSVLSTVSARKRPGTTWKTSCGAVSKVLFHLRPPLNWNGDTKLTPRTPRPRTETRRRKGASYRASWEIAASGLMNLIKMCDNFDDIHLYRSFISLCLGVSVRGQSRCCSNGELYLKWRKTFNTAPQNGNRYGGSEEKE